MISPSTVQRLIHQTNALSDQQKAAILMSIITLADANYGSSFSNNFFFALEEAFKKIIISRVEPTKKGG